MFVSFFDPVSDRLPVVGFAAPTEMSWFRGFRSGSSVRLKSRIKGKGHDDDRGWYTSGSSWPDGIRIPLHKAAMQHAQTIITPLGRQRVQWARVRG